MACGLGVSLVALGAGNKALRENLLKHPPFGAVSRQASAKPGATEPGATELRGIFGVGDACVVSLRRVGQEGESKWVRVGEVTGGWKVIAVNTAAREAVVEVDGRRQTLVMAKPDGQPAPVPTAGAPAAPPQPAPVPTAPQGTDETRQPAQEPETTGTRTRKVR